MKGFDNKVKLIAVLVLITGTTALSQSQSGWRGTGQSGIYSETGLLKIWPASGPELLWEAKGIGPGYSSVTVSDEAVYITGRKGNKDVLSSFSQDGKKNWEVIYGNSSDSNFPDSRCTPAFSNDKIFVVSGEGDMVCIGKDGKIFWSVNYFKKYKGKIPQFGISESPVIVDNKVIGTPGGNMASMVAFNVENGSVAWEAQSVNDPSHYVNPLLIETGGMKIIVTVTEGRMIAVNSANGKLLWNMNYEGQNAQPTGDRNHANTPVYRDGFILAANGYEQVALKLKINTNGSEPSVVWKNTDLTPHVGGMVLLGNYISGPYWAHPVINKGRLFVRHGDYLGVFSI